ncbi:MAG: MOSC domain-containing protein [Sphingomonadaceae bacterium]
MHVVSVSARGGHGLGKVVLPHINLVVGEGVEGDAHRGQTVKHRSRVAKDPTQPNLRQVHLIPVELLHEIAAKGFAVAPGELGENIMTCGVDLLGAARGTRLIFASGAEVQITGLRNPCHQLNGHSPGLMNALLDQASDGSLIRKGGVMAVVGVAGVISTGDAIHMIQPDGPYEPLRPV